MCTAIKLISLLDREELQELRKRRQRIFFPFFGRKRKVDLTASEREGGERGRGAVLPNTADGSLGGGGGVEEREKQK